MPIGSDNADGTAANPACVASIPAGTTRICGRTKPNAINAKSSESMPRMFVPPPGPAWTPVAHFHSRFPTRFPGKSVTTVLLVTPTSCSPPYSPQKIDLFPRQLPGKFRHVPFFGNHLAQVVPRIAAAFSEYLTQAPQTALLFCRFPMALSAVFLVDRIARQPGIGRPYLSNRWQYQQRRAGY